MKKLLSVLLAAIMCFGMLALSSCSAPDPANDWENIQKDGKFVVGCTLFEPMNYNDENGNFVGFDTELAQMVADELGVKVEFQVITWSKKYMELEAGKVDCLWNGFTSNSSDDGVARSEKVDFSVPYANNFQCIVTKLDAEGNPLYTSVDQLSGKTCAVEGGSAGEAYANTITSNIVVKDAQNDAFTELKAGRVDFIVVDVLLANSKCGKGDFTDTAVAIEVKDALEDYGIGFRKGSSFTAKVNEALETIVKSGKLEELSEKYGVPLSEEVLALKDNT